MEHSKLSAEFTTVAVFVASLLVSLMAWISQTIPPDILSSRVGWLIRILTATGAYLLLFKICLSVYLKFIWKLLHRDRYVGGHWTYLYNDTYDTSSKKYLEPDKQGTARLNHAPEGITLTAESIDADGGVSTISSVWESTSSSLTGERIDLSFNLVAESGGGQGFAVLHIKVEGKEWWRFPAKRPQEIAGYYFVMATETRDVRWGRVEFTRT